MRGRGYDGGYDADRRYARRWSKERGQSTAAAYVPLMLGDDPAVLADDDAIGIGVNFDRMPDSTRRH